VKNTTGLRRDLERPEFAADDRFFDIEPIATVIFGRVCERLAGRIPLGDCDRRHSGRRQHQSAERDSRIDEHRLRIVAAQCSTGEWVFGASDPTERRAAYHSLDDEFARNYSEVVALNVRALSKMQTRP
jgi:hypothetical protein